MPIPQFCLCMSCHTFRFFLAGIVGKELLVVFNDVDPKCFCTEKNIRARIRHRWMKTTVLSCQRCQINTGVEKMNNI